MQARNEFSMLEMISRNRRRAEAFVVVPLTASELSGGKVTLI